MYVMLTIKSIDHCFEVMFKELWKDNTDAVSNVAIFVFEDDEYEVAVQLKPEDIPVLAEAIISLSEPRP